MPHRVADYPSAPCIKRAVDAARVAGVKVATVAVRPDGTIVLSESPVETMTNDVDRYFAEQGQ